MSENVALSGGAKMTDETFFNIPLRPVGQGNGVSDGARELRSDALGADVSAVPGWCARGPIPRVGQGGVF